MQKSIKKIRKGVRWKTIPEDKIIGLCYDFMFCQVFGDKNLSFATNKLLADITNFAVCMVIINDLYDKHILK